MNGWKKKIYIHVYVYYIYTAGLLRTPRLSGVRGNEKKNGYKRKIAIKSNQIEKIRHNLKICSWKMVARGENINLTRLAGTLNWTESKWKFTDGRKQGGCTLTKKNKIKNITNKRVY